MRVRWSGRLVPLNGDALRLRERKLPDLGRVHTRLGRKSQHGHRGTGLVKAVFRAPRACVEKRIVSFSMTYALASMPVECSTALGARTQLSE